MIEEIKNIVELFLDKSKHWTLRAGVFISIIGVLFILDFSLDLSYNYYVNSKLENLEKIQILKKDYSKDTLKLKKILFLENKIINKKHYSEFIFPDLSLPSFDFSYLTKSTPKINDKKPTKTIIVKSTIKKVNLRSYYWMLFSSNFLLVIVFVVMLFMPLYGKEQRTLKSISGWFAGLVSLSVMMFIITWVAFKIPLIGNNPIYNYILNAVIHIIFLIIVAKNNNNK
ncbi:hypothetical protein MW871_15925 [Flavobacterium sp. I-SCBP12n]|uniref:Uncharacterized protein n=1 Tax=Flavobacterium pygoscelis TaxID=2893176 RepID=A0A9X2BPS3_9FLAO|nr:hypothetical protein [Flavobacterium pygoscelis]MCK8143318.1 hypothetical protein [Flavobacterium pygoscelis]MCK8143380.1 hypothetical protein [Flavobacterium pygoscelis]